MVSWRQLIGSRSHSIKLHNLRAVLLSLLWHEGISRAEIAQRTGLSTTTVTNLISELLEQHIITEHGPEQNGEQRSVGRPRVTLRLVPDARFAVGIHIGVGSVLVTITNLFAEPLATVTLEHPVERPVDEVLAEIQTLVEHVITESGVDRRNIVGVGVGASGLVDPQAGVNVLAPNLGWRDVPIRDRLTEALHLPVFVDNNVRAMALAEALFYTGQDARILAFVYASIGVGAGFVIDGQLYRGGAGAGEIGHVTILADHGAPCRCGNTGCLETLVSETVMIQLARELAAQDEHGLLAQHLARQDKPVIERIFDAAREGDAATCAMLNERATYMGIGLANLVNTLSPELIVLGGVFAQGQDLLFPVVEETMRQRAFAGLGEHVRLQAPSFGPNASVVGAAALALNAFFYGQTEELL
ncbi:MAG: ROK family transcriptional regulator [Anaerolineae bacterium]|nr:ROK family transcriptional regulator [Anaerolineae bacterium]